MYTENDRARLLHELTERMRNSEAFEGAVLIGSAATGFRDIYSDIDLMAGCFQVERAEEILLEFFREKAAFYIDKRAWSKTVLGLSAYWESGLSVDISFMPSKEIPLRSAQYSCLFAKNDAFSLMLKEKERQIASAKMSFSQHSFFYALRRMEIALCRGDVFYAEMALSDARKQLMDYEARLEGKKLHQFKDYHSLNPDFLESITKSYPQSLSYDALKDAGNNLINLFEKTISDVDQVQKKMIGQFIK